MIFPNITSRRLCLREHVLDNQVDYYGLLSNVNAIKYYGRSVIEDIEHARREIEVLHQKFVAAEAIKWAVVRKSDECYLGSVGVKEYENIHQKGTLSCILSPEHWGCGYASEALKCVMQYCFEELNLIRLQAYVDPQNHRAMDLFCKLGFKLEAIFKEYEFENGQHIDIAIWGLINERV